MSFVLFENDFELETILSIKNLDKKYGKIHAVKNLSFDIQKGNVYGILGPNGSGKSTTLGIVLNVVNKKLLVVFRGLVANWKPMMHLKKLAQ